jgi:hypothetical protein
MFRSVPLCMPNRAHTSESISNHALTDGTHTGQTIRVQASDGRLNAIPYCRLQFLVEFAPEEAAAPSKTPSAYTTPTATKPDASTNVAVDDGFAMGFSNPDGVTATATARTMIQYTFSRHIIWQRLSATRNETII